MSKADGRIFLFLQGPHGPFFHRLASSMADAGAGVRRIAFNPGDEAEWRGAGPLDRYLGPIEAYAEWLHHYLVSHSITDVVLYGDSRAEHAGAVQAARSLGIMCHCLEEGYLRPHCVTYERWGNNGNSRLCEIPLARIADAVGPADPLRGQPDDGWGAQRSHLWHSARYHARLLLPSHRYGRHRSRRPISLWRELGHYLRRVSGYPLRRLVQRWRGRRLLASGASYHLVLLQLSFDSSMQAHSDYPRSAVFIGDCIAAFARSAPGEDLLAIKTHPFEDGRERLGRVVAREAKNRGIAGRVVLLDGGPGLTALLDGARSAVTVNSSSAQQALWRGLPVAALGRAVYCKQGLVSGQTLDAFFADPRRPDQQAYWQFRRFLSLTSQLPGSFYSGSGIAALLDTLPEAVLSPVDPYERVLAEAPARDPVTTPAAELVATRPPACAQMRGRPQPHRVAV